MGNPQKMGSIGDSADTYYMPRHAIARWGELTLTRLEDIQAFEIGVMLIP